MVALLVPALQLPALQLPALLVVMEPPPLLKLMTR
jgi:hypothetical protein